MSITEHSHIVVVGASLGGLRCVETMRRMGHVGWITLIGAEPRLPYDRPPLSKEVLTGGKALDEIDLTTAEKLLDVDVRLGVTATALDIERQVLGLGEQELPYDGLVIATGSHARHLPGTEDMEGVHVIRTDADVAALAEDLTAGANIVVVGGGFIGAEAAASARTLGCNVTVIEAASAPMSRGLGDEMGTVCGMLHADNGTDLRVGVGVAALHGDGRVSEVELTTGERIAADAVVVGIGSVPTTDWLEGSGLELDNGVVCDEFLCASPAGTAPNVYAIGDVARWPNAWNGETMRVEHWTNAVEHAGAAARNLMAAPEERKPHSSVPFVWSDQYGHRIQIAGRPHGDDEAVVVAGSIDDREFVTAYRRGDQLTGVMAMDMIKPFVTGRKLLMQNASWPDTLAAYSE